MHQWARCQSRTLISAGHGLANAGEELGIPPDRGRKFQLDPLGLAAFAWTWHHGWLQTPVQTSHSSHG